MAAETPISLDNVSYSFGKGALKKQVLFDIGTERLTHSVRVE